MRKVTIHDLDPPSTTSPAYVLPLGDPLGTTHLSINYFELDPGDQFGYEFHRHLDQEEVFYIQQGTATFETSDDEIEVSAGEAIRFSPGEFQLGRNLGASKVIALALGAPKGTEEIEYYRQCPACETRTIQPVTFDSEERIVRISCAECDSLVEEIAL